MEQSGTSTFFVLDTTASFVAPKPPSQRGGPIVRLVYADLVDV